MKSYVRASMAIRMACMVYETLMAAGVGVAALIVASPLVLAAKSFPVASSALAGSAMILSWWLYFSKSWLKKSQTVPMKAWGLELRRSDGGRIGKAHALRRFMWATILIALAPMAEYAVLRQLGAPPFASFLLSLVWLAVPWAGALAFDDRQFLYDQIAGTAIFRAIERDEGKGEERNDQTGRR